MIRVLAKERREFERFLKNNNLSEDRYKYVYKHEQLYGIERGSILLMFESYKAHDNYHNIIREARRRQLDCIEVI